MPPDPHVCVIYSEGMGIWDHAGIKRDRNNSIDPINISQWRSLFYVQPHYRIQMDLMRIRDHRGILNESDRTRNVYFSSSKQSGATSSLKM